MLTDIGVDYDLNVFEFRVIWESMVSCLQSPLKGRHDDQAQVGNRVQRFPGCGHALLLAFVADLGID